MHISRSFTASSSVNQRYPNVLPHSVENALQKLVMSIEKAYPRDAKLPELLFIFTRNLQKNLIRETIESFVAIAAHIVMHHNFSPTPQIIIHREVENSDSTPSPNKISFVYGENSFSIEIPSFTLESVEIMGKVSLIIEDRLPLNTHIKFHDTLNGMDITKVMKRTEENPKENLLCAVITDFRDLCTELSKHRPNAIFIKKCLKTLKDNVSGFQITCDSSAGITTNVTLSCDSLLRKYPIPTMVAEQIPRNLEERIEMYLKGKLTKFPNDNFPQGGSVAFIEVPNRKLRIITLEQKTSEVVMLHFDSQIKLSILPGISTIDSLLTMLSQEQVYILPDISHASLTTQLTRVGSYNSQNLSYNGILFKFLLNAQKSKSTENHSARNVLKDITFNADGRRNPAYSH